MVSERQAVVSFILELAEFARLELHRVLGYESLFYYCERHLGLSKSSAFRRSESARLVLRFPAVAEALQSGSVSMRALVKLREVLDDENHAGLLARAAGMSEEAAMLLAVELRPRPVPSRDVCRALPRAETSHLVSAETRPTSELAGGDRPAAARETARPLTVELRRLNVTVSAQFLAQLEEARAALSHSIPDGSFERVVLEGFKLILERHQKRRGLTAKPRVAAKPSPAQAPQATARRGPPASARQAPLASVRQTPLAAARHVPEARAKAQARMSDSAPPPPVDPAARFIPAAMKRAVWKRDGGRCTWPMADGKPCGARKKVEFDHVLSVAQGGRSTEKNLRLLCRAHNLRHAELELGKELMAEYRTRSS